MIMDNESRNNESQIHQLETALMQQAESLAREQHEHARIARERLHSESMERLRLEEEREILAVKASAERLVRRQTQAAQTRFSAELDRLREALTEATLAQVRLEFQDLVDDDARYLPLLESWLAAAARSLPAGDLIVQIRAADQSRLDPGWADRVARAAPGRNVSRARLAHDSLGGLCVTLADGRARYDQTYEARERRLQEDLARVIMEQLFGRKE